MTPVPLFAESFDVTSPLDWLAIVISIAVLAPLAVGFVLVVRDTIRQRGNWGVNFKSPACTECGTPVPPVRKPANWRQALWGGWTCSQCGFELDKWGKPVENQEALAKFAVLRAAREAAERDRRARAEPDERTRGEGTSEIKTGGEV
jgi:hypothetical protein